MSVSAEAADLLQRIAGPEGSKKERQLRAYRRLSAVFPASRWTFNRVHDLFTRDGRATVRGGELEELRSLVRDNKAAKDARDEFQKLKARIARLEAALRIRDAEFHRPDIDLLRRLDPADRRSDFVDR